ncbi:2626_t:CDS:2 [Ambispora gerdemannii]|uniref:2626_t:CDS:1 n=1 Tax=Ambispora gerdemannii TaxID=144530 RepID=A0A9N8VWH6_9GLOM|nr:2626_t:CDS:2 [Ambispora gerdemannii]
MANEVHDTSILLSESQQLPAKKETFDQLQARHKKELKDLVARTTSLKKTATKGDKKRRKEVQAEIVKLETELHARHELEIKIHKDTHSPPSNSSLVSGHNNDAAVLEKTLVESSGSDIVASEKVSSTLLLHLCAYETIFKGFGILKSILENVKIKADKQEEKEEEDIIDTLLARLESMKTEEKEPKTTIQSKDKQQPKPKRQQKRKERKAAKFKEMQEQGEKEADGQINMQAIERTAIQELTKSMGLSIKEITPDGHCLYNAIADQLQFRHNISTNYKDLRKETANYMREHFDDFLPFLTTESGDPYNMEQFQKYCDELESTATWGGQLEVNALSKAYKLPVHIVQMDSPVLKISDVEFSGQQPIILSYHRHMYGLGEHYNSLRKNE